MWLFFEPLDVLLFRTPGPFSAGESHVAEGFFPPNPPTLMGAIRAAVLGQAVAARSLEYTNRVLVDRKLDDVRSIIGGPGDYGKLRVKGPFVAVWDEQVQDLTAHLPRPLDLRESTTRYHEDVVRTTPSPEYIGRISPPALAPSWSQLRASSEPLERAEVALSVATRPSAAGSDGETLAKYLCGKLRLPPNVRLSEIHETERRPGNMLDGELRTVQEGFLYHVDFSRLLWAPQRRVGLLCRVTGLEGLPADVRLPSLGCVRLGGEGRSAILRIWGEDDDLVTRLEKALETCRQAVKDLLNKDRKTGNHVRFSLYLLTPAVFRRGWQPDFAKTEKSTGGDYMECKCEWKKMRFRLVGAVVGKPIPIGGWDLFHGRPRPLRRAIPPGSVYHCVLEEGTIDSLMDAFWLESIMEDAEAATGMGVTLVGRW